MSPTLPNTWRRGAHASNVLGWRIGPAGVFFVREDFGSNNSPRVVLRRTTIAGSNPEETSHATLEEAVQLARTLDHIEESLRRNAEHQVAELLATPARLRRMLTTADAARAAREAIDATVEADDSIRLREEIERAVSGEDGTIDLEEVEQVDQLIAHARARVLDQLTRVARRNVDDLQLLRLARHSIGADAEVA